MYPLPIEQLIKAFSALPSVGRRTAERFVFYLLKSGKKPVAELTLALKNLTENIKSCDECWNFSDSSPCSACSNPSRDKSTICVVGQSQDVQTLEKTGEYKGLYHVLRGTIRTEAENAMKFLKIDELLTRVRNNEIQEVILALSPDIHGETTMMFLEQKLRNQKTDLKVTRLARGLPMGSDLQYADEITLGSALKNRTGN
ncbi:MAG: recombination mediator RecR [Candidatus Magasanikbacteria bacterium]